VLKTGVEQNTLKTCKKGVPMRKRRSRLNSTTRIVREHIDKFCNIKNEKTKNYIVQKLSATLTNSAKNELKNAPGPMMPSAVLELVGSYLTRLKMGICVNDNRHDGYILLNEEVSKMTRKKEYPKNLCADCVSPRVCKLKSTLLNQKHIAPGLYLHENIK
jgi:hypothetical protein